MKLRVVAGEIWQLFTADFKARSWGGADLRQFFGPKNEGRGGAKKRKETK